MLREEETVPSKLEVALLYPHNNCTGSSFSPSVSRSELMMTSSLKRRFHSPTSYLDGASSDQDAMGEEDENNSMEKRARRLSADQVKALEKAFEVENKLEPERKANLASQLGLQERQIAVWFQNRRARCKTKQMEKDFQALKKKMEALKADRDNLIKEKEQLEAEVLRLKREVKEKETVMEEERPATAEKAGLRLLRECENASTLMTSFNLPHASSKKEEASLCNNGSAIGEESTSESGLDCVEESSPKQSINSNLEEVAPLVADNAAVLIQGETVGFLQDMFPDAYDPKLLYELKGCLMSRAESSEFLTKEVAENDSGFVPFDWWEST